MAKAKDIFEKLTDEEIDTALTPMAEAYVKAWKRAPRSYDQDENESSRHDAFVALRPYDALPRRPKTFSSVLKDHAWRRLKRLIDRLASGKSSDDAGRPSISPPKPGAKMAQKKASKKANKKATKKGAKSEPTFADVVKPIVRKFAKTEDAFAAYAEKEKMFSAKTKAKRPSIHVGMVVHSVLEAIKPDESELPIESPNNIQAIVGALAELQPWTAKAAKQFLDHRPYRIAREAKDLTAPEFFRDGKYVRIPINFIGIANSLSEPTIGEVAEALRALAGEIEMIATDASADDDDEYEDEDEEEGEDEDDVNKYVNRREDDRDTDNIERWKEEDGDWSSSLEYLDTIFVESNLNDFHHRVEGLAENAEFLVASVGPSPDMDTIRVLAMLVPDHEENR